MGNHDKSPKSAELSQAQYWIYGGVGAVAFSTVLGIGLTGWLYEGHPLLGITLSLTGVVGLIAMTFLLRGHQLTVLQSAIAALFATWVFFIYVLWAGPENTGHEKPTPQQIEAITAPLRAELGATREQVRKLQDTQKNVLAIGAPTESSSTERGPINWALDSQLLVVSGAGPDVQIYSVLLQGTSTTTVSIKQAYAVSGLTGHQQELMANVQNKGYYPVDKVDIPAQAPVWLELIWKPPLSIRDFLDQWGQFRVTITYADGAKYEREFDEKYVHQKVQQEIPGAFGPRVTPREDK